MTRGFSLVVLFACGVLAGRASAQAPDAAAGESPTTEADAAASGEGAAASDAAPEAESAEPEDAAPVLRAPADAPGAAETAAPAVRPKVAIVVAGDPDETLLSAARALESALRTDGRVALPADDAMRAALRGEGMGDGLDDVRASRRRLGRSESADVPVLAELGRLVRAVLVCEVRATEAGGVEVVAYDVSQLAFFDGALDVSTGVPERAASFVARRAAVAAEGAAGHAEPVDEPEAAAAEAAAVEAAAGETETPPAGDPVLLWFEQNWAYIAAGVLLAGGIAFVAVVASDSGDPQPMLRFTPGGTTP